MAVRNLEEFNGKHRGKTAFIIGSGPSINFQIEDLKKISSDDIVIMVNSSVLIYDKIKESKCENFFFCSDDWSVSTWNYVTHYLKKRKEITPLIYENKLKKYVRLFNNPVLFRHRKGHRVSDIYEHDNKKNHIGESRTSVGTAIMISHIMECKPILMLGIDGHRLYGYRHFWQFSGYKTPKRNDGVSIDNYKKVKIGGGLSSSTDTDLIEINSYWDNHAIEINEQCEVYNCSKTSVLKTFPKINLEEFMKSR